MKNDLQELNLRGMVKSIETTSFFKGRDKYKSRRIEYFNKLGDMTEVKEYCQDDIEKIRVHYICEFERNKNGGILKRKEYCNGELSSICIYSEEGELLDIESYRDGVAESVGNDEDDSFRQDSNEKDPEPICKYDEYGNLLAQYWYKPNGELDLEESYWGTQYTYDQHHNWITCTYRDRYICIRKIEYY